MELEKLGLTEREEKLLELSKELEKMFNLTTSISNNNVTSVNIVLEDPYINEYFSSIDKDNLIKYLSLEKERLEKEYKDILINLCVAYGVELKELPWE